MIERSPPHTRAVSKQVQSAVFSDAVVFRETGAVARHLKVLGGIVFADAIEIAAGFTRPIVVSTRTEDGTVQCSIGAFMFVNDAGWALTAGHLMQPLRAMEAQAAEQEKGGVKPPTRLTHVSYWWGADGIFVTDLHVDFDRDLALAHLNGFESETIPSFPVFGQPAAALRSGDSLCRLGYPMHQASATFDETTGAFSLAPGVTPIPRFPIDGIYTRDAVKENVTTGRKVRYLETSSPGLRGQSGGPIFDTSGRVWAVQSSTVHVPLGFSPVMPHPDGSKTVEHQFMNLGLGCHVDEVLAFLDSHDVSAARSDAA